MKTSRESVRNSCGVPKGGLVSTLIPRHLVDAHRCREDQSRALLRADLDPIRIADPEPALGDLSDLLATARDLVLVIDDVSLGPQLATVLELDREALAQGRDQCLLHRRHRLPVPLDLHGVADVELLLLDLKELLTRGALEDECAPDPKRLAVDLECALAGFGLDPGVVADREQLLLHLVARATEPAVLAQQPHTTLLSGEPDVAVPMKHRALAA